MLKRDQKPTCDESDLALEVKETVSGKDLIILLVGGRHVALLDLA